MKRATATVAAIVETSQLFWFSVKFKRWPGILFITEECDTRRQYVLGAVMEDMADSKFGDLEHGLVE